MLVWAQEISKADSKLVVQGETKVSLFECFDMESSEACLFSGEGYGISTCRCLYLK